MSPDEMSEGLAFEKQLEEMLTYPDGTPKPDGTEILLKFVAVETRYTKKSVSILSDEFKKLLDEHNQRINTSVSCTSQEDFDGTLPKKGKTSLSITTLKILYSTIGIGGVVLLVVVLLLLKANGLL